MFAGGFHQASDQDKAAQGNDPAGKAADKKRIAAQAGAIIRLTDGKARKAILNQ